MRYTQGEAAEWFHAVVGQYEGPLLRYTARITRDIEQARDVVQDAFLRLHEQNGSRPENVQAWLYTVCRRRALDLVRKETRMKTLDEQHTTAYSSPTGHTALEQAETESQLLSLLAELPEQQQEVIRLKFQDGLSYRDIATVTGLSTSNVGYLLHTVVKKLREKMEVNEK